MWRVVRQFVALIFIYFLHSIVSIFIEAYRLVCDVLLSRNAAILQTLQTLLRLAISGLDCELSYKK